MYYEVDSSGTSGIRSWTGSFEYQFFLSWSHSTLNVIMLQICFTSLVLNDTSYMDAYYRTLLWQAGGCCFILCHTISVAWAPGKFLELWCVLGRVLRIFEVKNYFILLMHTPTLACWNLKLRLRLRYFVIMKVIAYFSSWKLGWDANNWTFSLILKVNCGSCASKCNFEPWNVEQV